MIALSAAAADSSAVLSSTQSVRTRLRESLAIAIIGDVPHASDFESVFIESVIPPNQREANKFFSQPTAAWVRSGQVAQVVERSPEKAGVGGSTPSLATMFSTT